MSTSFNYGDLFASVGGMTVAVLACISAVLTATFGKFKKLQLPAENAPGLSRGFLNVVLFTPFVVCFALVSPQNATAIIIGAAMIGVPIALLCFSMYGQVFANHRYVKPSPPKWYRPWIREDVLIGGSVLTAAAKKKQEETGQPTQEMLASAEYKPDEIWERPSRTSIQKKVEIWYYAFFLFAIIPIVAASLALQALISKESPLDSARKVWSPPLPTEKNVIEGEQIEVGSGGRYDGYRNPGCQAHSARACVKPQHGGKIVAGSGRPKIATQVGNAGSRDPSESELEYCISLWAATGACETPVFITGAASAIEEYPLRPK
jgi:hypothetical protein